MFKDLINTLTEADLQSLSNNICPECSSTNLKHHAESDGEIVLKSKFCRDCGTMFVIEKENL